MDAREAMQVINSRDKIEVLYNGSPVWLQSVNASTAKVKFMDSGSEGEVPVNKLIRGQTMKS